MPSSGDATGLILPPWMTISRSLRMRSACLPRWCQPTDYAGVAVFVSGGTRPSRQLTYYCAFSSVIIFEMKELIDLVRDWNVPLMTIMNSLKSVSYYIQRNDFCDNLWSYYYIDLGMLTLLLDWLTAIWFRLMLWGLMLFDLDSLYMWDSYASSSLSISDTIDSAISSM